MFSDLDALLGIRQSDVRVAEHIVVPAKPVEHLGQTRHIVQRFCQSTGLSEILLIALDFLSTTHSGQLECRVNQQTLRLGRGWEPARGRERLLVVGLGFGIGIEASRVIASQKRIGDRLLLVGAAGIMVSKDGSLFFQPVSIQVFHGTANSAMEFLTPLCEQTLIGDVLNHGMLEYIPTATSVFDMNVVNRYAASGDPLYHQEAGMLPACRTAGQAFTIPTFDL